jgi:hypothetical protein
MGFGSLASRHLDVSRISAFEFSHSTGSFLEDDVGLCVFEDLRQLAITRTRNRAGNDSKE